MIKAAEEEKWVEDKEEEGGEYRNRSQNQFQILTHQHSGCSSLIYYIGEWEGFYLFEAKFLLLPLNVWFDFFS